MNIICNERYKSTEEKIQRALFSLLAFRSYNDIAIKELCYEAGINRSSFYAHYQDINDLMIKTEQSLSKGIMEIFKPNIEWNAEVFTKLFEFLYKNKNFYKAYLETNEQTFMEKQDFINYIHIANSSSQYGLDKNKMVYHMAFFAGGLKAIAKSWLTTGCNETPEQMARIISEEYDLSWKQHTLC